MKKTFKGIIAILLLIITLQMLMITGCVGADYVITDIALTPGEDASQLNIAWYTPDTATQTVAQIALKADMTGEVFPVDKAITFNGSSEAATTGLASNKVTVTGLEISTEYVYRIGDGTNWSPVYNYATSNPDNFGFVFVGDPQIGYADTPTEAAAWDDTLTKAVTKFPDTSFIMSVGDQVQQNKISLYNAFFSPEELKNYPIAPAMGNHEVGNTHYSLHFNRPNVSQYGKSGSGGEDGDYYFTYGNALFMVLNTNNAYAAEHNAFIRDAVKVNPDAKWKILMFHHSIYSTTDHYTGAYVQRFIDGMVPVIEEVGIDMVLMGHDHVYVRTHLMKGNKVMAQQTVNADGSVLNPDGVLYITGNSATGSKYYEIQLADPEFAVVNSQLQVPTFSYVKVEGRKLSIDTYRTDTMTVVDSFAMVKNNPAIGADGLSVDSFDFVKDGVKTDSVYPGDTGKLWGSATLSNDSASPHNVIIALAKYNKDKQLVDIKTSGLKTIPAYEGVAGGCIVKSVITSDIDASAIQPGEYLKLFLWKDSTGIMPYTSIKEIAVAEEEPPQADLNVFRFECEELTTTVSGAEEADVEDSDAVYSKLSADGADDYVEYIVNFPSSGTWNISLVTKTSAQSGMFKLYLPQSSKFVSSTASDQYSVAGRVQTINIGNYSFKSAGNKQLRFIVTGKNDNSSGYILQNDAIILTKVQ